MGTRSEVHIKAEAILIAALVLQFQLTENIFVTTHRVQHQADRSAPESAKRSDRLDQIFERLSLELNNVPEFTGKVTVDTVERLQVSSPSEVVDFFAGTKTADVEQKRIHPDFIFSVEI